MNTISLYTYYIYDKYKDLKTTGKDIFNYDRNLFNIK